MIRENKFLVLLLFSFTAVLALFVIFFWVVWGLSASSRAATTEIRTRSALTADAVSQILIQVSTTEGEDCIISEKARQCLDSPILVYDGGEDWGYLSILSQPVFGWFSGYRLSQQHLEAEDQVFALLEGNIDAVTRSYRWRQD